MTHVNEAFDALSTMLAEDGPLSEDEIAVRLRAGGVGDAESVIWNALHLMNCPAAQLVDGRWIWLPTMAAGRVFTHRLSHDEVARDILTVSPDFNPIIELFEFEPHNHFADGSQTMVLIAGFDDEILEERGVPDESVPEGGILALPAGTLRDLGASTGDLVGIRFGPQGFVIDVVTATADAPLGAMLTAQLNPDQPVHVDAAVWTLCLNDPQLFTAPTPPLSEIIDSADLISQQDLLAPSGFDFGRWRFELQCASLAQRHDIEPDEAMAIWVLVEQCEQMAELLAHADSDDIPEQPGAPIAADIPVDEMMADVGAVLADPYLARTLVEETLGRAVHPAALGLLAETLEAKVPRAARVACRWLRAVALERIGAVQDAEREFLAAEAMDIGWPLTLLDLARFASDRGDAERGLALLRRAGAVPEHPLIGLLEAVRPQARTDLGRNEPCWCGSGRKYKKCHLGNEQLPLSERLVWLYMKASQHVLLTDWNELLDEVALERPYDVDPDSADPLAMDAVLFEGGAFADFLESRGYLLPDDERLLAEQWLLVDRSVFEIEESRPGDGVTLRDLRTGDTHAVHDRIASRQLKPGHLVCTRVLPVGEMLRFVSALEPVALHERDDLISLLDAGPEPAELVAFLSQRFAPLTLTNTEGHLVVICEALVRITDPDRLRNALDAQYDRSGPAEHWIEHVTVHGMQQVRSSFDLDGDTLRVSTNSNERMDDALAALSRLDPTMTIVDDERLPASDVREMATQEPFGEDDFDHGDPAILALLDEQVRAYEANWIDQPIPALHGVTPRQAADDPTRRGDLIKLLNSFPTDIRGGMDVTRLRAALGLT